MNSATKFSRAMLSLTIVVALIGMDSLFVQGTSSRVGASAASDNDTSNHVNQKKDVRHDRRRGGIVGGNGRPRADDNNIDQRSLFAGAATNGIRSGTRTSSHNPNGGTSQGTTVDAKRSCEFLFLFDFFAGSKL